MTESHRRESDRIQSIDCAVVTVSDSRTVETDTSGSFLKSAIAAEGYRLTDYFLIPDEPAELSATLERLLAGDARLLLFNGGTGISGRDNTFDTISRRLDKRLPGFGELFRSLSYAEIGAAAMLSRAVGGVVRGRVLFSMPGSPAAVRLAWEKLIRPEAKHLVWELLR